MAENKGLIAYCGIYCGDCFIHQGKVADLSRDLRKELRKYRFEKIAKSFSEVPFFAVLKDYPQCYDVLGALVKFRCQKKGIDGCWECAEFETCDKLDFLKANHGDANLKNLRKLEKAGVDGFLKGKKYWYSAPSGRDDA